jgi:hypothetical protein
MGRAGLGFGKDRRYQEPDPTPPLTPTYGPVHRNAGDVTWVGDADPIGGGILSPGRVVRGGPSTTASSGRYPKRPRQDARHQLRTHFSRLISALWGMCCTIPALPVGSARIATGAPVVASSAIAGETRAMGRPSPRQRRTIFLIFLSRAMWARSGRRPARCENCRRPSWRRETRSLRA